MTPAEHDMLLRIFCWLVWSAVAMYFGYKLRGWKKPERTVFEVTPRENGAWTWMTYTTTINEGDGDEAKGTTGEVVQGRGRKKVRAGRTAKP